MGYVDIDELMNRRRESQNLFGTVYDSKTKQYVSFPSVPTAIEAENIISENQETCTEKTIFPEISGQTVRKDTIKKKPHKSQKKIKVQNDDGLINKWIVRGKTIRYKTKLKEAGFQWDKKRKEWYTFHEPRINFDNIYDVHLYHVKLPKNTNTSNQECKNNTNSAHSRSFRWIAKGHTYPVKEELKSIGMRWDSSEKIWYTFQKPSSVVRGITFVKQAYSR